VPACACPSSSLKQPPLHAQAKMADDYDIEAFLEAQVEVGLSVNLW
jgi:hypothetical protein